MENQLEFNFNKEINTVIDIERIYKFETDNPLKAFVDVIINNAILIKGIRVMDGKKGLFVTMPREQARDGKWYDTIRCLTLEIQNQITKKVLEAYNK